MLLPLLLPFESAPFGFDAALFEVRVPFFELAAFLAAARWCARDEVDERCAWVRKSGRGGAIGSCLFVDDNSGGGGAGIVDAVAVMLLVEVVSGLFVFMWVAPELLLNLNSLSTSLTVFNDID